MFYTWESGHKMPGFPFFKVFNSKKTQLWQKLN